MLIASSKFMQDEMGMLIGLVIAIFIITACYVGYHASQEPVRVGGHGITIGPEVQDESLQILELDESVILRSVS